MRSVGFKGGVTALGASVLFSSAAAPAAYQPDHWATQLESQLAFSRPPYVYGYELFYRSDRRGSVRFQPARRDGAPLIIWLAGYGPGEDRDLSLEWLPSRFFEEGYAYAGVSYDRPRNATFAEISGDLLMGIRRTLEEAAEKRIDTSRIILMGAGIAGQVVALFATDPSYFASENLPFESIRAALIVEGNSFDLPAALAEASPYRRSWMRRTLGDDPAQWERLSPVSHLAQPNVPRFIFLNPRSRSALDAERFAARLREAGAAVRVVAARKSLSDAPATRPGAPQHRETRQLMTLLAAAVER